MKKFLRLPLLLLSSLLVSSGTLHAGPESIRLWPEGVPGVMPEISEASRKMRSSFGGPPNQISDIQDPEILVYRPRNPNGTAVIVAPGGGFLFLSWIHEGSQVCEWLNELGVTAVLLKYRTPTRDEERPYEKPAADAQRAIGILRHRAQEWSLDPKRIGLLGFSAGGNLLGHVACDRGPRTYPFHPERDDARGPDFGIMIYGGGFVEQGDPGKFREGFSVPPDAPPLFMAVAHDDKKSPLEMVQVYIAYKKQNLSAELHVYAEGGHGFGMRKGGKPVHAWPDRCAEWMSARGLLPKPESR